ncbi:MAG TPA: BtpA/SgcQ family protein [Candidatus Lokiarchaeia archaeon]|nr:BtpA/SgcQ family protein [Candidatus Lokiarchaeia archaeon]
MFTDIFPKPFTSIGMVHLLPLPGAAHRHPPPLDNTIAAAVRDATVLQDVGFDGVLIENFGDAPFYGQNVPADTVSSMSVVAWEVRKAISLPIGINVLRNDALAAIAVAKATHADFIRINIHMGVYDTDQGRIEGAADETLRYRTQLGAEQVNIFTDAHVKHAQPVAPFKDIFEEIETLLYRGDSDAIILTGPATGKPADLDVLQAAREKHPQVPILIGSGVTVEQLPAIMESASGVIIGTSIKTGGKTSNPVDPDRAQEFMNTVNSAL